MAFLISGDGAARSLSNGPPGATRTSTNAMKLITSSNGTSRIRRRTKYMMRPGYIVGPLQRES